MFSFGEGSVYDSGIRCRVHQVSFSILVYMHESERGGEEEREREIYIYIYVCMHMYTYIYMHRPQSKLWTTKSCVG